MRNLIFTTVLLFLAVLCTSAQKNPRVLILGLDGLSAEGFKVAKHPNLDKMIAEGLLSLTTRPVMPSITLPNWTSHFTGSGPEEHGVNGNAWTLATRVLTPLEQDDEGYYPSFFKVLKDQKVRAKTAYYYNWKELIYPINKKYLDEIYFEEKDEYKQSYKKAYDFLIANQKDPTLVFLYSVHTDHAGHGFGWMSPEYIRSIEEADTEIGVLLDKLKATGLYKDTHILLITDHGGVNKGHGGVSMVEMQVPWAITGPQVKQSGTLNSFNSNKNTSLALVKIFGITKVPDSWTGTLPKGIFSK